MSETSVVPSFDPVPQLAREMNLPLQSVAAVVKLLAEQATVPFIARYRKEVTGGLDEVQIRDIQEKRTYLIELEDRRGAVLASIAEQGKLTPELEKQIRSCTTKATLEDLYLPYKQKRRTKAIIAKEKGLEPLALRMLEQPMVGDANSEAAAFVSEEKGVKSVDEALQGARDIVAEAIADRADVRAFVRNLFEKEGLLKVSADPEKTKEPTKFEQYYDFAENIATIPSHRFLAVRRGEKEGILRANVEIDEEKLVRNVSAISGHVPQSPFAEHFEKAAKDASKRLIAPSVENDVRVDLKMKSDRAAVEVFADNLKNLLLSAPMGGKKVIGIDPGLRTGCKCAVIDDTSKFIENITIYPSQGAYKEEEAKNLILALVKKYEPFAIAVGNGTGGRETESFVKKTLADANIRNVVVVSVSESGASVYSASDVAREEFPDLDLTVRGAISIARRLQDPLAELVKVDPKAIGVGQYQHDVHQPMLARKLSDVVESCVNNVGVDLNTASAPLLSYVAGIGESLAKKIVQHRETKGLFKSRKDVLTVSGLGPRAFEQAAGFLRVRESENPLDASAVHPERYSLVEQIAGDMGIDLSSLVGNAEKAKTIDIKKYITAEVGEPTLKDIVAELQKPGRDPRSAFEAPAFRDDVMTMNDLTIGMILEGVITNVTAFGAFCDIGVHQDGLIHISQLSDRFIQDPREAVKVGDKIKVKVLEVDLPRKRISLTAKMHEQPQSGQQGQRPQQSGGQHRGPQQRGPQSGGRAQQPPQKSFANNPFAALLDKK